MHDLPHLLKRAHFIFRQGIDAILAEYGLTAAQMDVLQRVAECECAEHRALQQQMGVSSPTLTKLVDSLVESGYLQRQVSDSDARVKVLVTTEKAMALKEQLDGTCSRFIERSLCDFSPAERLLLVELLQRLIDGAETEAS